MSLDTLKKDFTLYFGMVAFEARPQTIPTPIGNSPTADGMEVTPHPVVRHWVDKKEFDHHFHANGKFTFSEALHLLKMGYRVRRWGWNGAGMWLVYIDPNLNDQFEIRELAAMQGTLYPTIYLKGARNELIPWVPSQLDLVASDWGIIDADLVEKTSYPAIVYDNPVHDEKNPNARYRVHVPDFDAVYSADSHFVVSLHYAKEAQHLTQHTLDVLFQRNHFRCSSLPQPTEKAQWEQLEYFQNLTHFHNGYWTTLHLDLSKFEAYKTVGVSLGNEPPTE